MERGPSSEPGGAGVGWEAHGGQDKGLKGHLVTLLWQKTATAVAFVKDGRGLIKVNGAPIENLEPEILRLKTFEPVLLLGQETFSKVRREWPACGGVGVGGLAARVGCCSWAWHSGGDYWRQAVPLCGPSCAH